MTTTPYTPKNKFANGRSPAEQEHTRAEAATQRAAQAEEQAARYAAMLKAMGVTVDAP